jgi:hypothetical protein
MQYPLGDYNVRRRQCHVTRRTPRGSKCIPVPRAHRRVHFLAHNSTSIDGLPVVNLDPFQERHVFRCHVPSKFCPQFRRYIGSTMPLAMLKAGAMRGCALCILGYFSVTMFYISEICSSMLLTPTKTRTVQTWACPPNSSYISPQVNRSGVCKFLR